MSRCEYRVSAKDIQQIAEITQALSEIEGRMRQGFLEWPEDEGFEEVGRLLGLASRLYTAAGEAQTGTKPLPQLDITATDAVVCSAALLKDQNISLFEMSGWYTRVTSYAGQSNSWNAQKEELQREKPTAAI